MTPDPTYIEQDDVPSNTADVDTARYAGLVLAAGTSGRFGDPNKLLADLDGTPLVEHAVRTLQEAGLNPVIVVTGYQSQQVTDAVAHLDITIVENPDYEAGHGSTVATGMAHVPQDREGVVIALGDMPFVDPKTIATLLRAHAAGLGSVLAAAYQGARGNPVLFDAAHFDALRSLSGDTGGKSLIRTVNDAVLVETGDPGVLRDVDTPSDLPD